jgi:hypothetical protein
MKNSQTALKISYFSVLRAIVFLSKKIKLLSCVFLMSIGTISGFSQPASAMDYILGAKGGYFIWDPYLKEVGPGFKDMKNGDGVLYGPVASIMFTQDLSFSLSGLFGKQSTHWMSENSSEGSSELKTSNNSFDIQRYDVDSALSYKLTDHFKIFAGYKYQYQKVQVRNVKYSVDASGDPTNIMLEKTDVKIPYNGGPALGLGVSAPLGERFFFASNISALYMWGKFHMDGNGYEYNISGSTWTSHPQKIDTKTKMRGINIEPTVGGSMGEGMPIFTLGVRFQWTQVHIQDKGTMNIEKNWANDYLYGVFVSIIQPI